jgi:hypothetical protein
MNRTKVLFSYTETNGNAPHSAKRTIVKSLPALKITIEVCLLISMFLALSACATQNQSNNNVNRNIGGMYDPQTRGFTPKWPWGPGP